MQQRKHCKHCLGKPWHHPCAHCGYNPLIGADPAPDTSKTEVSGVCPHCLGTRVVRNSQNEDFECQYCLNLWFHIKRGTLYKILEDDLYLEKDMTTRYVSYVSIDGGKKLLRPYDEFHDGRFKKVGEP